jgi:hypothetical protein
MTDQPQLPAGGATLNDPGLAASNQPPDEALLERVKACLPMDSAEDTNGFQRDVRSLVAWATTIITGVQPS